MRGIFSTRRRSRSCFKTKRAQSGSLRRCQKPKSGQSIFPRRSAKLVEAGLDEETVDSLIASLQLHVVSFDREQARLAGSLRRTTREFGLSLGDRACLALARVQGAVALTCDRSWTRFDVGCRVELAR